MVQDVKAILTLMHQSTYTMEHFNEARKALGISRGLTTIGNTRFWTYVSAVESVHRCLPAFRAIIKDRKLSIDISVRHHLLFTGSPN